MRLVVDTIEDAQETLGHHELSIFEKPQKPSSFPDVVGILVDTPDEALRLRDAFAPKEPSEDEVADDSNPYNAPDTLEADIYERLSEDIRLADGAKFSVRPLETRSEDLLRRAAMSLGAEEASVRDIIRMRSFYEGKIMRSILQGYIAEYGIQTVLEPPKKSFIEKPKRENPSTGGMGLYAGRGRFSDPNHRFGDPEPIFPIEDPGYWRQELGSSRVERVVQGLDLTPPHKLGDERTIGAVENPILNKSFDEDAESPLALYPTESVTNHDPILEEWLRTHGTRFGLEGSENKRRDPGENTEPPQQ